MSASEDAGLEERWIVRWYQSPTPDDDDVPTQVNIVFYKMECRRENLPIEGLYSHETYRNGDKDSRNAD